MRLAAVAALFLGLLLAIEMTHLGASRSQEAYERFHDLRKKEVDAIRAEATRPLTEAERKIRDEASSAASQVGKRLGEWQAGSFLALGFLGCGAIWLAIVARNRRAPEPGTRVYKTLKASLISSLVGGCCLTAFFGVAFWLVEPDGAHTFDRYEWEVRWLTGAIAGAILGAAFGLLAASVSKLFPRNRTSE